MICHPPGGDLNQPAARVIGHALLRPLRGRREERLLHRVFCSGEFLNPGLLGHGALVRLSAAGTIDEVQLAVLARGLRPFILRRTKEQVAGELAIGEALAKVGRQRIPAPPADARNYNRSSISSWRAVREMLRNRGAVRSTLAGAEVTVSGVRTHVRQKRSEERRVG